MRLKNKWVSDYEGKPLKAGDRVRVCGVPNLSGMSVEGLRASLPAFRYAVGKVFTICHFDDFGFAVLDFFIPCGDYKGHHSIYIETFLLKKIHQLGR